MSLLAVFHAWLAFLLQDSNIPEIFLVLTVAHGFPGLTVIGLKFKWLSSFFYIFVHTELWFLLLVML